MSNFKGFLLDFDGTIVENSTEILIDFTHSYINRFTYINKDTLESLFINLNKFPTNQFIKLIFEYLGLTEHLQNYVNETITLITSNISRYKIREGLLPFVDECVCKGIKLLIFSNQNQSKIKAISHGLFNIDILELGNYSKASVDDVRALLKRENIEPSLWFLIDDDPYIIRTGKIAGLNTILMKQRLFFKHIHPYKPYCDFIKSSFKNLISHIHL